MSGDVEVQKWSGRIHTRSRTYKCACSSPKLCESLLQLQWGDREDCDAGRLCVMKRNRGWALLSVSAATSHSFFRSCFTLPFLGLPAVTLVCPLFCSVCEGSQLTDCLSFSVLSLSFGLSVCLSLAYSSCLPSKIFYLLQRCSIALEFINPVHLCSGYCVCRFEIKWLRDRKSTHKCCTLLSLCGCQMLTSSTQFAWKCVFLWNLQLFTTPCVCVCDRNDLTKKKKKKRLHKENEKDLSRGSMLRER